MKKILLAVLFAVTVPAWAGGSARDTAEPDVGAQVGTNDVLADPMDDRSECLNACEEQYSECLGNASDATSECDCFNGYIGCRRRCGIFRPFVQC